MHCTPPNPAGHPLLPSPGTTPVQPPHPPPCNVHLSMS
uniref:Uncharacterized protein n=1 Tax=Arundo donax TaxID=35708 RepID=A0A0A9ELH4_ARUDO